MQFAANCAWGSWTEWSDCTEICEKAGSQPVGGTQERTGAMSGGAECKSQESKTRNCGCSCEGLVYRDPPSNLNMDVGDLTTRENAEGCKQFCKETYNGKNGNKKAIHFAWVGTDKLGDRYKNSCWCKGENTPKGERKQALDGVITGKINCEGMDL